MIAEVGIVALGMAFAAALIALVLALVAAIKQSEVLSQSARNLQLITLPLLSLACLLLIYGQWTGEYSIAYVNAVSSDAQPDTLKITALWGSQAGSLLFYGWMLSLFSVAAVSINWERHHHLMPWVMVVTAGTLSFFLFLSNVYENPFERTWIDESGDPTTVETHLFPEDGQVVAYPWRVTVRDTENNRVEDLTVYTVGADVAPEVTNPRYELITTPRYDGNGLNPLLRHPGMVIHPPMLYLGFTGFVIPFAFAMAALAVGQMNPDWIRAVRTWSLIAWMFLSIGLVLGGRWAYDVLGWGGYWGWDPVENSALLPWLTGTAFLHSVMIQEKRGMLKGWNMAMIISTYLLVLLGTVATRTGLLSSVHTFAQSPLALPMGAFLSLSLLASAVLFVWRGNQGYFAGDHEIEGMLSRESMFLLNNWVFLSLTVVIFFGTWAEKITDFLVGLGLWGSVITLGRDYYETATVGLFLLIYLLMGVAPLVAWRRATFSRLGQSLRVPVALTVILALVLLGAGTGIGATMGYAIVAFAGFATLSEIAKGTHARHRAHGEPYVVALVKLVQRDRRRYGGYFIHIAVVVMGIGIIASTLFQEVKQQTLVPGETLSLGSYVMRYDDFSRALAVDERDMYVADVTVLDQEGNYVTTLRPRRDVFDNGSPMSIAGVHSTVNADFYVLLAFWENNVVTFRAYYNPLISLVWTGGILLVLGTLVAAWPEGEKASHTRSKLLQRPIAPIGAAGD